jgi:hypothetical protein
MSSEGTLMDLILYGWPYVGLMIAGLSLIRMAYRVNHDGIPINSYEIAAWALFPLYTLHQFEEHGIDLYGRRYEFQQYFCKALGYPSLDDCESDIITHQLKIF